MMWMSRRRREARARRLDEGREQMAAALAAIRAESPRLRQAVDDLTETLHDHQGPANARRPTRRGPRPRIP